MSIELCGVSKRYGPVQALDNVSVTFASGRIYGLLGNNGAGKSTLLNLITDRTRPDTGAIALDGAPVKNNDDALYKLFLVGEQNYFPDSYKVKKAFAVAGRLRPGFDAGRADAMCKSFGLKKNQRINALSTGYGTIFRIILALCSDADYLLLDEPVLGLDAQHRELFYRELMADYAARPRTIILSTHLIAEVENLIEEAVILRDGRVLRSGPAADMTAAAYTVTGPCGAVDAFLAGKRVLAQNALGGLKTATVEGAPDAEAPAGLEFGRPGLQDYFVSLMEKEDAQ